MSILLCLILEPTCEATDTDESNAGRGEIVSTVPNNDENVQLRTSFQIYDMSNYIETNHRNQCEFQITASKKTSQK